jgi:hypothetical protein
MDDEIVVAAFAARLDVAGVHHEVDVIVAIDLGHQPGERRFSCGAIRHVADQREGEGRNAAAPVGRLLSGTRRVHRDKAHSSTWIHRGIERPRVQTR